MASQNIVVFYDSPCIDGASAAWAINEAFKNRSDVNVEYIPLEHGDPEANTRKIISHLHDGAEAVFVDTSPKGDTLKLLFDPTDKIPRIKKLTILDHHNSEVERLRSFELEQKAKAVTATGGPIFECIIDAQKPAAALLAWEYYNKDKDAPELLGWVGQMEPPVKLKTNRELAIAAFIDSHDIRAPKEAFSTIDQLVSLSQDDMVVGGNSILAEQFNNIEKGIRDCFVIARLELLPGRIAWVPLVNANVRLFGRSVDNSLIEEAYAGATCGVSGAFTLQSDLTVKLSLRSKGVPSVGEIAKHISKTIGIGEDGGGGHDTAAAATFTTLLQFAQNVPLYTKEKMVRELWTSPVRHDVAATRRTDATL